MAWRTKTMRVGWGPSRLPSSPRAPVKERVAVAVDLEDGADDAADGLHLVTHLDARALRLPGGLRLALLGTDEEEVAEDPDRQQREQGQERARRRFRGWRRADGADERQGWLSWEILGPGWLRRATLVPVGSRVISWGTRVGRPTDGRPPPGGG